MILSVIDCDKPKSYMSCVGVAVAPQVSRGGEAFITNLAGVRLPGRVNPLVVVKVAGRREPTLGRIFSVDQNERPLHDGNKLKVHLLRQTLHWWGLSPLCILVWVFRLEEVEKVFPQW